MEKLKKIFSLLLILALILINENIIFLIPVKAEAAATYGYPTGSTRCTGTLECTYEYSSSGGDGYPSYTEYQYECSSCGFRFIFNQSGGPYNHSYKYTTYAPVPSSFSDTEALAAHNSKRCPYYYYKISYDANGGTCTPTAQQKMSIFEGNLPIPTRTGYRFMGWYLDDNATVTNTLSRGPHYRNFSSSDYQDDITFRAKWEAESSTLKYCGNVLSGYERLHLDADNNIYWTYCNKCHYYIFSWITYGHTYRNIYASKIPPTAYTGPDGRIALGTTTNNYVLECPNIVEDTESGSDSNNYHYSVKYNANGGSGSMSNQTMTVDRAACLTSNTFTRTGYHFAGWSKSSGGSADYTNSQLVSNLATTDGATVNLYAIWEPNVYTVKFDANNGTGSMNDQDISYASSVALRGNAFSRQGYKFIGWSTSANGSVVYSDRQTVSNLASAAGAVVTLYAKWAVTNYTIAYNANGGSGSMSNQTAVLGGNVTLNNCGFSRGGYTFKGWSTSAGGGVEYSNRQACISLTETENATVTLYAVWEANTYSIVFDSNGGNGYMVDENMIYGKARNLTPNSFEYPGKKFLGWSTTPNGSVAYSNKASVNNLTTAKDGLVTLYAVWASSSYTVMFNANGGIGDMSEQPIPLGVSTELNANKFKKEGYHFIGWSKTAEGTSEFDNSASVKNLTNKENDTVTLYAVWAANSYKIAFDANGGKGIMNDQNMTYNLTKRLTSNNMSCYNARFLGWSRDPLGEVEFLDYQSVINLTSEQDGVVTLYAIWNGDPYTVKLDANGGTGTYTIETQFSKFIKLDLKDISRVGYDFKGWSFTADGGVVYRNGDEVNNLATDSGEVFTLYAVWEPHEFDVVFDGMGGSGSMDTQHFVYGQEQALYANQYTKTGYHLAGWAINKTDDFRFEDEEVVSNLTDGDGGTVTLYAKWKPNTYEIVFHSNGADRLDKGSITEDTEYTQLLTYDTEEALIQSRYSKVGYSFSGWATSVDGAVAWGNAVTVLNLATEGKVHFYAVWKPIIYEVIFDANDGSGKTTSQQITYDEKTKLKNCTFTREDYQFKGWSVAFDGPAFYSDGAEVLNLSTGNAVTFYAVWEGSEYTVKYDANGGEGIMDEQTWHLGIWNSLDRNKFTRRGYSFKGWSLKPEGGVKYKDQQYVRDLTEDVSVTLYAAWEPSEYSVTFDFNGATEKGTDLVPVIMDGTLPDIIIPKKEVIITFDANDGECTESSRNVNVPFKGYLSDTDEYYWDGNGKPVNTWNRDSDAELMAIWGESAEDLPMCKRKGYKFAGWSDGSANSEPSMSYATSENVTLYAVWEENSHSVVYDYTTNGGTSCDCESAIVNYGESVDLTPTAKREGYVFTGWGLSPDEEPLTKLTMGDEDITLYALFKREAVIDFVGINGTDSSHVGVDDGDDSIDVNAPDGTSLEDWDFVGWTRDPEGGPDSVTTDFTAKPGETTKFYGVYSCTREATFIYGAEGEYNTSVEGESWFNTSDVKAVHWYELVMPDETKTIVPDDWALEGWLENNVDYVKIAENGETILLKEDRIFYALYTQDVILTYDVDGGEPLKPYTAKRMNNTTAVQEAKAVLERPKRTGFVFECWYVGAEQYNAGDVILLSDDLTVKAQWGSNAYTIEFESEDATGGTMHDQVISYGTTANLNKNTYTKDYTVILDADGGSCEKSKLAASSKFIGWECSADGKTYEDEAEVSNLTLDYEVPVVMSALWEDTSVDLPIPTRAGYTFVGWSDGKSQYKATYKVTKDTKLTAIWSSKRASCTIKTYSNVGDILLSPEFGQTMPAINSFSREYTVTLDYGLLKEKEIMTVQYVFEGIFDSEGKTGTMYYDKNFNPTSKWDKEQNSVLYVAWTTKNITLPTVTDKNYEIDGWYDGTIKVAGNYVPTANTTLTLKYTKKTYNVDLNTSGGSFSGSGGGSGSSGGSGSGSGSGSGGSGSGGSSSGAGFDFYEPDKTTILPIPTKPGYTFEGWYDENGNRVTEIPAGSEGSIKLEAHWSKNPEVLTDSLDRNIPNFTVPEGTTKIPDNYFEGCTNLEKVTFPDGLTEIGNHAFSGCTNLVDVKLPDNLSKLGDYAFSNCTNLTTIEIPGGVTTIGKGAFSGCTNLSTVIINEGTKVIGDEAFKDCTSLKNIVLPSTLTTIGNSAFENTGLVEITLPTNVETIGNKAFYDCDDLEKVTILNPSCDIFDSPDTFPENAVIYGYVPSTAKEYADKYGRDFIDLGVAYTVSLDIGDNVQVYKLYVAADTMLPSSIPVPIKVSDNKHVSFGGYVLSNEAGLRTGTDAQSLIYDGNGNLVYTQPYTFGRDIKLSAVWYETPIETVETVNVGDIASVSGIQYRVNSSETVTAIGAVDADRTKIVIPAKVNVDGKFYKVTAIKAGAFRNMRKLRTVTIGKNVRVIGAKAFYKCSSLSKIVVKGKSLKRVGKDATKGTSKKLKIVVAKKAMAKKYRNYFAKS